MWCLNEANAYICRGVSCAQHSDSGAHKPRRPCRLMQFCHGRICFNVSHRLWARILNGSVLSYEGKRPGASLAKLKSRQKRGTGAGVIQTDDQMLLAQECVANLRRILLEARRVHSREDYARMAQPILLEVQQREQEILEYLSSDSGQPIAS
jgi:hypothetical protein